VGALAEATVLRFLSRESRGRHIKWTTLRAAANFSRNNCTSRWFWSRI